MNREALIKRLLDGKKRSQDLCFCFARAFCVCHYQSDQPAARPADQPTSPRSSKN